MAIKVLNSQGTKVYVIPSTADMSTCPKVKTAIGAGKLIGCPQSLGDLARSRAVQEYACISSNDSMKSTGKITYGDFSIELLFDPTDTVGQKKLFDAMEANKPIILAMESPNADTSAGTTGASGDIVWTEALVSGDTISFPVDGLVGYNVTMSPYGGYMRCSAVAGTT
jgi:hypothetical protein